MTGVVLLLLGFNAGETSWSSKSTIVFLSVGGATLVLGAIQELFTKRSPIIPPRLFKTRTTIGILCSVFIHSVVFFAASYYAPVYFQVLGDSATLSGLHTMALSFGGAATASTVGIIVAKTGSYRPIIWFGWGVMNIGLGLMATMDDRTDVARQEIYLLVTALGLGCLFQPPLIGLQAAMPLKDMATSTATFGLLRTLGGTIGISIGGAIFTSEVTRRLKQIPQYHPQGDIINNLQSLSHIEPPFVRMLVLHAYTHSISMIWLILVPLIFVGVLLVLPIRAYSLKRHVVQAGKDGIVPQKGQKGDVGEVAEVKTPENDGQTKAQVA